MRLPLAVNGRLTQIEFYEIRSLHFSRRIPARGDSYTGAGGVSRVAAKKGLNICKNLNF